MRLVSSDIVWGSAYAPRTCTKPHNVTGDTYENGVIVRGKTAPHPSNRPNLFSCISIILPPINGSHKTNLYLGPPLLIAVLGEYFSALAVDARRAK